MEIVLKKIQLGPLKNINIKISSCKITAILGSNGSGKSYLAELLATLRKPNKGQFFINNKLIKFNDNTDYNKIRFNIGLVMQNLDNQFFQDTIYDHILFQLRMYNYKSNKKRIIDSLKMVGLDSSYLNRKIKTLSDGEKFLASFATILSLNPSLIILDDPTCFLDEKRQESLIKLLKMMKIKYNKTIIILSSSSDFILEVADYVYLFDNKKIISEGNKYEIFFSKKCKKYNIAIPDIIYFQQKFKEKSGLNITYRDNVNDLIKDIYYYIEEKNRGKK